MPRNDYAKGINGISFNDFLTFLPYFFIGNCQPYGLYRHRLRKLLRTLAKIDVDVIDQGYSHHVVRIRIGVVKKTILFC